MKTEYVPMKSWEYDQIAGAIKPLDALAVEMESRWGRGRLEELVSPSTAARFEFKAKLDIAIHDRDVGLVIKRAETMMRGWKALENEVIAAGYEPAPPDVGFVMPQQKMVRKKLALPSTASSTANLLRLICQCTL